MSRLIDSLAVDTASALRSLAAAPAIPLAAILTTALAFGLNLAMLALIDRALLSPPPHVVEPSRIYTVGFEFTRGSGERVIAATTSYPALDAIRQRGPGVTPAA